MRHHDAPIEDFRLDRQDLGPVTVVAFVIRRLISTDDIETIGEAIESLVEQEGRTRLVLNLDDVEFPSSAFLGRILWILIRLKARGGRLALCHLSPALARMFSHDIDQVETLGVFSSEAEAVAWAGQGV